MKRQQIRYILSGLLILFLTGFLLVLFLSEKFFNNYFDKYLTRFNERTTATAFVDYKKYSFPNSVEIAGISLVTINGDTLIKIDSLLFKVKLLSILKRDPSPSDLIAKKISINIIHTDSLKNYRIWEKEIITTDTIVPKRSGYNVYVNTLLKLLFDKIPSSLDVKDIMIDFTGNYGKVIISVPVVTIKDKQFSSDAVFSNAEHIVHWRIRGSIDSPKEKIIAQIKQSEPGMKAFAGVLTNIEMHTGFDSLHVELYNVSKRKEETNFYLKGNGNNLRLFHYRLANDTITIPSGAAELSFSVKQREITINEQSKFELGEIPGEFNLLFNNEKPEKIFFRLETEIIDAQMFFNSLPQNIFQSLKGIQLNGKLAFQTEMGYDFAMPDSAVFFSRMIADNFSITKMGEDDLRMMNNSFTHRVYERGRMIRSIIVGPENPAFTPIDYISPYLRNSILTSEDGGFYSHKGFNEDAFRQSIVENIEKRRFARGGSTITMQLVKNVYLKRDKVISRKLEEALIVWLIENQRLVSKHRMFEVYLNIIEWGPGIYGINEASAFYFLKQPSELTLAESIFLASIVPRPKLFRYSFDEFGNLRGYLEGYYRLLAGIMLRRGQITQTEYDSLTPHIVLQGPARDLVLPPDSLLTDPWLEDEIK